MASIYDPQDDDTQGQGQSTPLQTIGTAGTQSTGTTGAPSSKPQGSGRFTNLQKYVQANQGAGQRIAGKIGNKVSGEIDKKEKQANTYNQQLGDAVTQAQDTAQQGSGYAQQLRDMGSSIQGSNYQAPATPQAPGQPIQAPTRGDQGLSAIDQFTSSPNFQQFQDIQSGRAINENLLGLRQRQAATGAQDYLSQAQGAQDSLGSEGGRFDLLRKTFGGAARPDYTTGQQRLDQLFLTRGGLGDLRQNIGQEVKGAEALSKSAGERLADVNRIRTQEQGLIGDIGKQSSANESAYLDMLKSYIDPTNQYRQDDFQNLDSAVQSYRPPAEGQQQSQVMNPGFNQDQMDRLGVNETQGVYNVFNNIDGASAIANQGRQATAAQDIASQSDVDRYASLARIMGMNPQEQRLTQASDLGASYTAKDDEAGLAQRMAEAQKQFDVGARQNRETVTRNYGGYGDRYNAPSGQGGAMGVNLNANTSGVAQSTVQDMLDQGRGAINSFSGQGLYGTKSGATGQHGYGSNMAAETKEELDARTAQHINQYGNYRQQGSNQTYADTLRQLGQAGQATSEQDIVNQFKKYIDDQNYNRTIGGRRTTFLDDEAGGEASTDKYGSQLAVTGTSGTKIPGKG